MRTDPPKSLRPLRAILLGFLLASTPLLTACEEEARIPAHSVIPNPTSVSLSAGDTFHLGDETRITFQPGDEEAERIGQFLADLIGNTVETTPEVTGVVENRQDGSIHLTLQDPPPSVGPEGYELVVSGAGVTIRASSPAGLFYGVQTLRQLLPPVVEYTAAYPKPLYVPAMTVMDTPRFPWRGAMLDVSRHFFQSDDVKRFIDLMALYKLNRLHLHLSDDQGWRIEIPSRPNLTLHGGSTEVGGREGGFFSVDDFSALVQYAADRFVTIVPEIDVPGHTNAALASYPELNCDGVARDLYTGTSVGFSALCTEREEVYEFLEDVVRDIAAVSPGAFFHVGGDEVERLGQEAFNAFIERMEGIVESNGKRLVGWEEVSMADIGPEAVVQLWRPLWKADDGPALDSARAAQAAELQEAALRVASQGTTFILSPADRLYLDMKYNPSTAVGLTWAGMADVRTSYDWTVGELFGILPEESIAGVEAPLWSETIDHIHDIEYLAFPRLAGAAEIGWSLESGRSWEEYRIRLGAQAPRWTALGVNFYRSPDVPWVEGF